MKLFPLTLAATMVLLTACQTYDPYTGDKKTSNATTGSVIGAVSGAVIGAATSSKKDRKKGILTGAVAGGAIGGGIGYYMDQQEAKLREKLAGTGVQVSRQGDEITLIMPGNITFDTGRSEVKTQFHGVLSSVGTVLQEFNKTSVEVSGHTDSTGGQDLNQRLSEARARSVASFLTTQGVSSNRIYSVGYGPRRPVATNDTLEGRSANRRVELKLVPSQG
jgi:outer membrane protein OmpA-like peptidoglycan-associated protein